MKQLRKRLTYANVMSTIAVFLLLGGATALAATKLAKNSVGTKQLKNEAVTPPKLSKAAKATLTGPTGATGSRGEKGETGSVASPTSLFRGSTFLFETIQNGTESSIATVSYTPSISGTALVFARGYCNIAASATEQNEVDLKLGKTQAEADGTPLSAWGVIRVEHVTATGDQGLGFTAETEVPVTAGKNESVSLFAIGIGAGHKDCTGSLVIHAIF